MTSATPLPKPRRAPVAAVVGVVLALAVAALGAVLLRDAAVGAGWVAGSPWVTGPLDSLDGLTAGPWTTPAGVVAVLLGLALVVLALTPRRTTHRQLGDDDVWVAPDAVSALAAGRARRTDGVVESWASSGRRGTTVTVSTDHGADGAAVAERARADVAEQLGPLAPASLTVRPVEVRR